MKVNKNDKILTLMIHMTMTVAIIVKKTTQKQTKNVKLTACGLLLATVHPLWRCVAYFIQKSQPFGNVRGWLWFRFFKRKLTSLRFSKKTKVTSTYELISCGNCHEMFNCNLLCIEITQKMYTCYMSLKILQIKVLEFCSVKLDRFQSLKRFLNSIKYLTLLKFNTETQTIRWLYLLHTKRLCLSTLFNMMLEPIIDTRHHWLTFVKLGLFLYVGKDVVSL